MDALRRQRRRWSGFLIGTFLVCSAGSAASVLAASEACCPSTVSDGPCAWMTPAACCDARVVTSAAIADPTPQPGNTVPFPSAAPDAGSTPRFVAPAPPSADRLALATIVLQR